MKIKSLWTPSALAGLALACWFLTSPAVNGQTITGTNQIGFSDFDTAVPGFDYGYFYSWGFGPEGQYTNGTYGVDRFYSDPLIDPTNGPLVIRYSFTNSAFYELITTNAGAGYGTGFGAALVWGADPSVFNNLYLSNYLFEFDARVEGLDAAANTANGEMQVQIFSGSTKILQKNLVFNPGSNWAHFSFTLEDGGFGDNTTYTGFTNNMATISALQFNVNFHMPHSQYGWDDHNVALLDNLKLSVVQFEGVAPPPPPVVPLTILDWNMDDKPLDYTYGGYAWSQNSFIPTIYYSTNQSDMAGFGAGGSNAWWIQMDNSVLAAPNTPQYAGGGTGGSGPVNFSQFDTGDLRSYLLTFDARAEGLTDDITTAGALQLFLDSPVTNGNLRLDFPVPAGSNWTTTSYTLNLGSAGTGDGLGPKASFATNYNTYTALRLQWQIENATSSNWGFDGDNRLVVDNIRLQRLVIGTPSLTITTATNNVIVTWAQPSTGSAKLQSANSVNGTFSDVAGATSPYVVPIADAPKYFRSKWVPPTP